MKKVITISFYLLFLLNALNSQEIVINKEIILKGFSEKIAGADFGYTATIPGYKECLLIRATTGKEFMEWYTEPVPAGNSKKDLAFIWLAGLGSNLGNAKMIMTVNDTEELHFYTSREENWEVRSEGGVSLSFVMDGVDGAGDLFGFMFLRVPQKMTESNSQAWYMAFKRSLESGISMSSSPAIIHTESGSSQIVGMNIYHFGSPENGTIFLDGEVLKNIDLKFGHQFYRITVPETSITKELNLKVESMKKN